MTCEKSKETLSAYIDDELGPIERAALEEHLRLCPSCDAELTQLTKISNAVKSLPDVEADALHENIMASVPTTTTTTPRKSVALPHGFRYWAMAAAVVLIFFGLSSFGSRLKFQRSDVGVAEAPAVQSVQMNGDAVMSASAESDTGGATSFSAVKEPEVAKLSEGAIIADVSEPVEKLDNETAGSFSMPVYDSAYEMRVKNFNIQIKTEDFDKTMQAIYEINGQKRSHDEWFSSDGTVRTTNMVLCVSQNEYESAKQKLRLLGVIVHENEAEQLITLNYLDNQAILSAKLTELTRLKDLLDNTNNLDMIIAIEKRISVIETELDDYKATMFSQLQDSSGPLLDISIMKESVPIIEKPDFWQQVSENFMGSYWGMVLFFQDTILALSVMIVPLILCSLAFLVIFFVIKQRRKKDE